MSLINDALKRASQSEKARSADTGLRAPMQPTPERRRSLLPILGGMAVLALLGAASWLIWRTYSHQENVQPAPPPVVVKTVAPTPAPKPEPANIPAPVPVPVPAPVVVKAPPVVTPSVQPAPPVIPETPAAPTFPELKLQGIFYSRANPKCAINGQVHAENEQVGEVRIVKITQNTVTVEWNGKTKDLVMEQQ